MFGSNTLEIAIGIILLFFLVSTLCTAVREGIEAKLKTRAAYLEQGIRELLNDFTGTGMAKSLYDHPLISGLFNGAYKTLAKGNETTLKRPDLLAGGKDLPSYIPSKNFARALMDIATRGKDMGAVNLNEPSNTITIDNIRKNISNLGNPQIERAILNALDLAQGDLLAAETNIENWFNSSMDRISGWYKRSTQWIVFWIALSVAVIMNINVFTVVDYLSKNDTARKILVQRAGVLTKDSTMLKMDYIEADKALKDLKLPIGWLNKDSYRIDHADETGVWNKFLGPVLGWLITALAATMGAPYWFDLLNKFMVIRSTVKPKEKSGEEPSRTPPPNPPTNSVMDNAENEPDCCSEPFNEDTPDQELPASKGGVAL